MMMMPDRLRRGHERCFSDAGSCSHPSAESLIGRLDELDIRLRQLEEKQAGGTESYFSADMRRNQCKSISSALHDVRLKGTLVDRIQLLESQIRQLSSELDKSENNPGSSINGPIEIVPVEKKTKQRELKEAIDAKDKKRSSTQRNEKRKRENSWLYKRWFPVGC